VSPEERVLSVLTTTGDPWEVAGRCRLPFAGLADLLRSLADRELVRLAPGRISLTPAGRRAARLPAGLSGPRLGSLAARYRRMAAGRPPPVGTFDQGHLTVDSVLARVRDLAGFGDLYEGVRIAVLGDDDLLSLALALTGAPERVAVFEVDDRLTRFIADRATQGGLPVEVHTVDLRRPLPARHLGGFDVFVCDPSETEAGLRMFVGRGLSCLRPGPGGAGYFGMTLIEADLAKWRALQRWLTGFPVAVSAILPDHGRYENWPTQAEEAQAFGVAAFSRPARSVWYRSSLFRVETLEGFVPPRPGPVRGDPISDEHFFGARVERR
jgi:predicted methyltransferase